jgi:hypothetical protein
MFNVKHDVPPGHGHDRQMFGIKLTVPNTTTCHLQMQFCNNFISPSRNREKMRDWESKKEVLKERENEKEREGERKRETESKKTCRLVVTGLHLSHTGDLHSC